MSLKCPKCGSLELIAIDKENHGILICFFCKTKVAEWDNRIVKE